jgi:hypothetical protein
MEKIFIPYQNWESLDGERFFRELTKAGDGLGILDEDCRASDIPPHPLAKFFGEPELFDQPIGEPKIGNVRKTARVVERQIGTKTVRVEFDGKGGFRSFLKE